jgi:FkbM family methyltransferase
LTSYAQNFEDVLLWRALKEVETGFYIDVGAQDPVIDSVSLAFYERGWRGLHVEPTDHYAGLLRAARPDEEIIQAAISTTPGLIDFYEIESSGLSTADTALAERHERDGFPVRKVSVPSMRLEALLDKVGGRDVHWMKIDVEGLERQVIESWGDSPVRPWVLVVESTRPRTQEDSADWEPLLTGRGYRPVHFDGLNRFYVSEAHADLAARFTAGPNTFDDFVLAETNYFARPLAADLRTLRHQLADRRANCEGLEKALADHKAHIGYLEAELAHHRRHLSERHQIERLQQEAIDRERAEFTRLQTELHRMHSELEQHAAAIAARLAAIENSRSWRWTGVPRRIVRLLKGRP